MMTRALIITAVALALVVAGAAVYTFGKPAVQDPVPVTGSAPAEQAAAPVPGATTGGSGGGMGDVPLPPKDAKAPAPDPSTPLAIEIPGCVCHSDDPAVVKEHEQYRMNQCAGCHSGQTPTGQ